MMTQGELTSIEKPTHHRIPFIQSLSSPKVLSLNSNAHKSAPLLTLLRFSVRILRELTVNIL